ncbi:MarR family winged helix-turn-helix transcriptional regulator [Psychroflexus aestuariivivens]|uniref:MarR family winged helix-turn-helix transcriptional regulator n=1 Tax=Psychroflexus aestuariivivens TaxID=1795040 RepID=UPI000FDACAA0|nr:MarR family transcriptional regulator [Psychroflexus aestuariivivens]
MIIGKQLKISKQIPEYKKALLNVLYTGNWLNDEVASALKPFDISPQQFNVLRILRGMKGEPASLQVIQDRMISKMSNTTRLVDKLLTKDFVTRKQCESNRRKVDICITKSGLDAIDEISKVVDRVETNITENLQENELLTLNKLLNKLRE